MIEISSKLGLNNTIDSVQIECLDLGLKAKIDLYYLAILNGNDDLTFEDIGDLICLWDNEIQKLENNDSLYIPFQIYDEYQEFFIITKKDNKIHLKLGSTKSSIIGSFYDFELLKKKILLNEELIKIEDKEIISDDFILFYLTIV